MTYLETPSLEKNPQPYTGRRLRPPSSKSMLNAVLLVVALSTLAFLLLSAGAVLIFRDLDNRVRDNLESAVTQIDEFLAENPTYDLGTELGSPGGQVLRSTSSLNEIFLDENHIIVPTSGVSLAILDTEAGYEIRAWHRSSSSYKNIVEGFTYSFATGEYSGPE